FSAVAFVAFLAPAASAQVAPPGEATKLTQITFSGPVELPGVTLPGGTYTFQIPWSAMMSGGHVVEVFNKDRTERFARILTIPNYRLDRSHETVVMFEERPAGTPQAAKVWFYPENSIGEEFI